MSSIIATAPRETFEWIEIEQAQCALDYSNNPCEAVLGTTGANKCFNTRETCQDPDNYDQSNTLTLRFCRNQGRIPGDAYYFPYLQSAKVSPARINAGGANRNSTALGTRASLSITLSDHPHTDRIVDPYQSERDYIASDLGTFWTKWKARNPYYIHSVIRHKSGYFDADGNIDVGTLITRTFFVADISGPTNANTVSITAKDVLSLAADEKAKAPQASKGKLFAAIDAVVTTATLTPLGIGNAEYPASGKIRINKEVMSFTRVSDVLTITRAQNNTTSAAHDTSDSVQLCLEYSSVLPADILEDLLTNYANIDPSYLDLAQWAAEAAFYLPRLYSTIITEPTGVTRLISEMCEQMYFTTFWDERESLLKMRALRPAQDETITSLNDDLHLLEDTVQWTDSTNDLITKVFVYYAQKDPTESQDDTSNYAAIDVIADLDAESDDKYGIEKIKVIKSRWMTATDGAAAIELGEKILERYNKVPKVCAFSVDAKDRDVWLADFVTIQNRNVVDFIGNTIPVPLQIISAQESQSGTTYSYSAIEYIGNAIEARPDEFTIDISADITNANLRDIFDSAYAVTPISGDKIRFTVRSGATIGGQVEVVPFFAADVITRTLGTTTDTVLGSYNAPYMQRQVITVNQSYVAGDEYDDPSTGTPTGEYCLADLEERPVTIAVDTGLWPAGVELFLDVEAGGQILGEAGNGGYCALTEVNPITTVIKNYVRAGDGGHALEINHPITINNLGIIGGGGGGGEMSGFSSGNRIIVPGAGGAGYDNGFQMLTIDNYSGTIAGSVLINQLAGLGDKENAGFRGLFKYGLSGNNTEWSSGSGGNLAAVGATSSVFNTGLGDISPNYNQNGRAGFAVASGANDITWIQKGDIRGAEFA